MAEGYRKVKLPPTRLVAMDIGMRKHYVKKLIELDVTDARRVVRDLSSAGAHISFTGWIIKCLAEAAFEFPEVHSLRKGRRAYVFDDVDVAMPIEAKVGGQLVPLPYVVRKCRSKNVLDISGEIDALKKAGPQRDLVLGDRRSARLAWISRFLPKPVRMLGLRLLMRNPVRTQRIMGTVT